MNKSTFKLFVLAALIPTTILAKSTDIETDDRRVSLSENLDLFNVLYRDLDLYYVDTIDAKKVIKKGIDAMLEELDPYTVYIPEEDEENFKFMLTGEYAGVGASLSKIGDYICFTEIYEGSPSDKCGVKAGDRILEIDGKNAKNMTVNQVSENLRGESGKEVKLTIQNPLSEKKKKITIKREKIVLPAIEYADTISKGIGYIGFTSFTEKSAEAFKKSFLELKNRQGIQSLIIDLRNNPGGLLDQATEIVNYFIENQSTIVYTKGKVKELDETYKANKKPIDEDMPIVVLVNKNSASASEIFSGAMQDFDRAVIVGERTFGKGLVQTTRDLPFGGNLKVTVSKYYIPSGRCVQAINYSDRDEFGNVKRIPDSLTTKFQTRNGRIVRDGGGITPDITVETKDFSTIAYHLYTQNIIFNYALQYTNKHPKISNPKSFKFDDYNDFKEFVRSQDFQYNLKTEESLKRLKEIAKVEGYAEISTSEFDALEKKLTHNLSQDLDLFEEEITKLISIEIMKQTNYQKGSIEVSLKFDNVLKEAVNILNDETKYHDILNPKKK